MVLKIQIAIVLFFIVIVSSCVLAKSAQTKPEEVPGMVFIKGGTYEMGEKVKTTVTVGDFYIGKYEVTNKEYCQYDPNHNGYWSNPDYPVESVSWNDAVAYCKWLSNKAGKNYRLPTEKEWEYACRAGSTTEYYWGENMNQQTYVSPSIDNYAWCSKNSGNQVHSVGQKQPNAWGLYDMSGNVWEWCSDWYNSSNSSCVVRGGCWSSYGYGCKSGGRDGNTPDKRYNINGFRVVMTP